MVDLSQNQTQKQEPTSNAPASDKPPVTQPDEPAVIPTPGAPNKPPDYISTPPIKDEEKIDSPEQEEIKKELSELGISPQGGSKKTRVILAALGVFFLVATLPAAVYLVKQRQEIRKEAYSGEICTTKTDCSGANEVCSNGTCTCASGYVYINGVCVRETTAEICTGGIDEDGDGKIDCADSECANDPACQVSDFCGSCAGDKSSGWINAPGPSDCNGERCNDGDWNYCCWDEDHDNTCDICARGPGPGVNCDESGDCISLSGLMPGDTVKFCKFYSNSNVSCPYSTGSLDCSNVTVPPSGSITRCIPDGKCGQLEADGYCGVCKETGCGGGPPPSEPPEESPPPSVPPETALCEYCKVFDEDWNEITDFSTITVNQTIYLATRGATGNPKGITKARFRINGGDWIETTSKHGNRFYIQYIILEANTYTVQSMIFNPDLGWY